ncbi:MAG: WG repeat-containing protein [Abditibacteriota bacterium]|nr:WG repeat-containing protein [Abditibacteriota bacterium]
MKRIVFICILLFLLIIGACLYLSQRQTGYLDLVDNKKHYTNYMGNQFKNNYAIIYKNDKNGLIDQKYNIILKPEYIHITSLSNDIFLLPTDNKYMFYNPKKNKYSEEYNTANVFNENLAGVTLKNKNYIINDNFDIIKEIPYKIISPFFFGNAVIKNNNLCGVINSSGKILVYPKYKKLYIINEQLAAITLDNRYMKLLNLDTNQITDDNYSSICIPNKCGILVTKHLKYGLLDDTGKMIVPIKYSHIDNCVSSKNVVLKTDKCIYIYNIETKKSKELHYGYIPFGNTLSVVFPINLQEQTLLPVEKDNKWGYCDFSGNIIIDFKYDKALHFNGDFAMVTKNDDIIIINNKGEEIKLKQNFAYTDLGEGKIFFSKE